MNSIVRHSLLGILLFSSCFLLGCGGCATTETQSKAPLQAEAEETSTQIKKSQPVESKAVYTYLVFNRALHKGDLALMVATLDTLSEYKPPVFVFIDAGIWALERGAAPLLPYIKRGLEIYPDNVSLQLLVAELLQKTGKAHDAITHIQSYIAKNPTSIDAKVELALLLANEKKFTEAEAILQSIEDKDRSEFVDYYHAKALLNLNRKDEARAYFEASVQKAPDFVDALNDLAFIYEQDNELEKARDTYDKILENYGSSHELIMRVILLSLRLKDIDRALELFEDNPLTPELTVGVASMFVDFEQYDTAEPILLGLADIEAAPQELYFYLAAIAFERDNDAEQAYTWLTHIQSTHKEYNRALFLRIKLLMELQRFDEALEEAHRGTQIASDQMDFWTSEVHILSAQKKFDQALQKLELIQEKWPQNGELTFLQASILDQSGHKKEAFETMESLLKLEPEHVQALNYVGYTLAEQSKELQRAITLLRKANELSPNSNYILDSLAWALFQAGQSKEAWTIIKKAVEAEGMPEATIWEHYGDIARSLGKKEEAHKGYTKAIEISPNKLDSLTYKQNQL